MAALAAAFMAMATFAAMVTATLPAAAFMTAFAIGRLVVVRLVKVAFATVRAVAGCAAGG